MKKRKLILSALLAGAIALPISGGLSTFAASEHDVSLEKYEVDYENQELGMVTPEAYPALAWMAGAVSGYYFANAIDDLVQKVTDAHSQYGPDPVYDNVDYRQLANQQGPWSDNPVKSDVRKEFGR